MWRGRRRSDPVADHYDGIPPAEYLRRRGWERDEEAASSDGWMPEEWIDPVYHDPETLKDALLKGSSAR
jgi:hypothetical protein